MWQADIITYLPEAYPGILGQSVIGKALEKKLWSLNVHPIADFGHGKHKMIDDSPFGGGAGMLMRPDVASLALDTLLEKSGKVPIICPSPRGKVLDQTMVRYLSQKQGAIFLCGRFEGIDARIFEQYPILEVSLGDYILCGGDIAAQVILEAILRLKEGILGNGDSSKMESFEGYLLEHPHYTRPQKWRDKEVPEVLLSGNHKKIEEWRFSESKQVTKERRPDLWKKHCRIYEE